MIYVITVVTCFVVVGIAYFLLKRSMDRYLFSPQTLAGRSRRNDRYDAVKIVWPRSFSPCSSMRQHANVLYLSDQAPSLPLKRCDQSNCQCYYKYYSDRRTRTRRVLSMPVDFSAAKQIEADERRTGRDRRIMVAG